MLQHIKVASDCKTVVSDINIDILGVIVSIVKDINQTAKDFQTCSFVHEGRLSNMEAHDLAEHAFHLDEGRHLWLLDPHDSNVILILRFIEQ